VTLECPHQPGGSIVSLDSIFGRLTLHPLLVAGSVAGLVSLADVVFRKLFHYTKDAKNAEKDVQIKNELAALNGVLHNL
jgi:hypothetical protein